MSPHARHRSIRAVAAAVLSAALWCSPLVSTAAAEQQPPAEGAEAETPARSRAAEFKSIEGKPPESIPGGPLLIGAYAVAWLLLLGFVVRIARLQAGTMRDVARLERSLGGRGSDEQES